MFPDSTSFLSNLLWGVQQQQQQQDAKNAEYTAANVPQIVRRLLRGQGRGRLFRVSRTRPEEIAISCQSYTRYTSLTQRNKGIFSRLRTFFLFPGTKFFSIFHVCYVVHSSKQKARRKHGNISVAVKCLEKIMLFIFVRLFIPIRFDPLWPGTPPQHGASSFIKWYEGAVASGRTAQRITDLGVHFLAPPLSPLSILIIFFFPPIYFLCFQVDRPTHSETER